MGFTRVPRRTAPGDIESLEAELDRLRAEKEAQLKESQERKARERDVARRVDKELPQRTEELVQAYRESLEQGLAEAAEKLARRQLRAELGATRESPPKRLDPNAVLRASGLRF